MTVSQVREIFTRLLRLPAPSPGFAAGLGVRGPGTALSLCPAAAWGCGNAQNYSS